MEKMTFPHNLRRIRLAQRLTQAEAARRCGLAPAVLAFYEQGRRKPGLDALKKLCDGLKTTADRLMK